MKKKYWLFVLCLYLPLTLFSQKIGPWDTDALFQSPDYTTTTLAPAIGVTSILYNSVDYKGDSVKVFAYYGVPEGTMPAGGWPAVIYVHGGGGTASAEWVKTWNHYGFAALAMDTEGHYPTKDDAGVYLPTPHPGPSRDGVWNDYALPIDEQWYYHAVSQIILGHSLLRSFPEVNAEKTGIMGISWGGNLTSTVMGVDNRFKFAIPIYGAGYLSESDGFHGIALWGDKADTVNAYYDGSLYFDNVTCPTLWINGTNDFYFSMPCTQQSSQAVQGPATLRYSLRFAHGHNPPLELMEIYAFAKHVVNGASALPVMGVPIAETNIAVSYTSENPVTSAQLIYTKDDGIWSDRYWYEAEATISGDTVSAERPKGARYIYFTATDSRGMMVSSEYIELEKPISSDGNLALFGTASQSTTDFGGEASRAIDGNTSGAYGHNSVTHTIGSGEDNPWWQVDLGRDALIDTIKIWNRTDECCIQRLKDFKIQVLDNAENVVFSHTVVDSIPDPFYTTFPAGVQGRYVKVQLTVNGVLSLAEVQVFGRLATNINVDPGTNEYAPDTFSMDPNYPNPFNPNTTIQFNVPEAAKVELTVYDIQGRSIRTLIQERVDAGIHSVEWNATDAHGLSVPSGTYFYRLNIDGQNLDITKTGKMTLVK